MADNEKKLLKSYIENIFVEEVMEPNPVTVYEDDELSVVEKLFVDKSIYYIPVIDRNDQLVGLASRKYLYKTFAPRKILNDQMRFEPGIIVDGESFYDKEMLDLFILRSMMHKNPPTMGLKEKFSDAIQWMLKDHMGCIIIIDKSRKPKGILTSYSIVSFLGRILLQ